MPPDAASDRAALPRTAAGLLAGAALLFVAGRALVAFVLPPLMDWDAYKFLGGADALLHDGALPPLFRDQVSTDGALHAVPGYAVLVAALWTATGVSIPAVLAMNVIVSAAGYAAGVDLLRRWQGPAAATLFALAVAASPALAWLEALAMPDALAAPLVLASAWLAWVGSARAGRASFAWCFTAGALVGAGAVMRATSQVFFPVPLAVLAFAPSPRSRAWRMAACAAGTAVAVAPLVLHNGMQQGVWRITGSSGRMAYFSAAWSGIVDRAAEAGRLGVTHGAPTFASPSAYPITEEAFQSAYRVAGSIPAADADLFARAAEAWRSRPWREVADRRLANLAALFAPAQDYDLAAQMQPMRGGDSYEGRNPWKGPSGARVISRVYKRQPSPAFLATVAAADRTPPPSARATWRAWIDAATLDGLALAALFAVGATALAFTRAWMPLAAFVLPPLLFLVPFLALGTPVYRYQVALHPFFLATAAAAAAGLIEAARSRAGGARRP